MRQCFYQCMDEGETRSELTYMVAACSFRDLESSLFVHSQTRLYHHKKLTKLNPNTRKYLKSHPDNRHSCNINSSRPDCDISTVHGPLVKSNSDHTRRMDSNDAYRGKQI